MFNVVPINKKATQFVPERKLMDELNFVKLLYRMREKDVPQEVLDKIGVTV